jgi:hypothetical protein
LEVVVSFEIGQPDNRLTNFKRHHYPEIHRDATLAKTKIMKFQIRI